VISTGILTHSKISLAPADADLLLFVCMNIFETDEMVRWPTMIFLFRARRHIMGTVNVEATVTFANSEARPRFTISLLVSRGVSSGILDAEPFAIFWCKIELVKLLLFNNHTCILYSFLSIPPPCILS